MLLLPWLLSYVLHQEAGEKWISGQFDGQVTIGDASLGWSSPVLLNDVTYTNQRGETIANVKAVTSNQSLWDLLQRPKRPIDLEFEGLNATFIVPRVEPKKVELDKLDVNVVLERMFQPQVPRIERDVTVRVVQSQLDLKDASGKLLASWQPVSGTYTSKKGSRFEQTVVVDAPVSGKSISSENQKSSAGQLTLNGLWSAALERDGHETFEVNIECDQQPMNALQPLLEASLPAAFPMRAATGKVVGTLERVGKEELTLKLDTQFVDITGGEMLTGPINFDVDAEYSKSKNQIDIDHLFVQLGDAEVEAQGTIEDVSGRQVVGATGNLKSPTDGLKALIPEEVKQNVQFQDLVVSETTFKGPLRPDPKQPFKLEFELSTIISWKNAIAYGLNSENGKVRIALQGQDLLLTPLNVPVSGGHVRQLPKLNLATSPPTLSVEQGLVLERVALTENVCRDWLQYVSPVLSRATRPSGSLSLQTAGGAFQLEKMNEANLSGELKIHKGQVKPGPMIDDIVTMVTSLPILNGQGGAGDTILLKMDEQSVDYQVVEGRVYHAGFRFNVGTLNFSSSGSVGLDETLDVVVSMEFPEKLVNRGPVLQSLKDETLDFHLTGTLEEPIIDSQSFKDFGKRVGLKAAAGLLEQILNRRRERRERDR